MKNSRSKGAGFELLVAKAFSQALGLRIRRTPLSGGWSHGNPDVAGDLVCVDGSSFPYCVECKCEEGWCLESLFTDKHKWFDDWWVQTKSECPHDKEPILVFSRNRQPVFAAVDGRMLLQTRPLFRNIDLLLPDMTQIKILLLEDLLAYLVMRKEGR